jgi:hypothetical protein
MSSNLPNLNSEGGTCPAAGTEGVQFNYAGLENGPP